MIIAIILGGLLGVFLLAHARKLGAVLLAALVIGYGVAHPLQAVLFLLAVAALTAGLIAYRRERVRQANTNQEVSS